MLGHEPARKAMPEPAPLLKLRMDQREWKRGLDSLNRRACAILAAALAVETANRSVHRLRYGGSLTMLAHEIIDRIRRNKFLEEDRLPWIHDLLTTAETAAIRMNVLSKFTPDLLKATYKDEDVSHRIRASVSILIGGNKHGTATRNALKQAAHSLGDEQVMHLCRRVLVPFALDRELDSIPSPVVRKVQEDVAPKGCDHCSIGGIAAIDKRQTFQKKKVKPLRRQLYQCRKCKGFWVGAWSDARRFRVDDREVKLLFP